MDWLDYREKLGIGLNDEHKAEIFFIKLRNWFVITREDIKINKRDYFVFCNMTGTPYEEGFNGDCYKLVFGPCLNNQLSIKELLSYYVALINCIEEQGNMKYELKRNLDVCLRETHISFDVVEDAEGYYVFPKGVEEFDNALVSANLHWLKEYPEARKAWSKALRKYAENDINNASDVADAFRKSLETFFKEFFGGNRSLENYKSEYGKFLKDNNVPKEIANQFETMLHSYYSYMNHNAKHNDSTNHSLLEYLMYQTGNVIRLLITIKKQEINLNIRV